MSVLVQLDEIEIEGNRKYTKDDGFDQLVNSIREHGVIEPPHLRMKAEGGYKIVAGRRRIDAARVLKMTKLECMVRLADDPANDEDLALAENVNRLEMHPLDEAAIFAKMAGRGSSVDEIARYYARSPSAIYKRLRLANLIEELKGMFRDGWLDIAGAAVLAELPEEDQKLFFEQLKTRIDKHDPEDEINPVEPGMIYSFVAKQQRFKIKGCMKGCEDCMMRTHNEDNELFEEYNSMSDVCLDGECYRRKWKELIEAALTVKMLDMPADAKIYFSGGMPQTLYKQATHMDLHVADQTVRFEVLKENGYEFTGSTERKKDTCWKIMEVSSLDHDTKRWVNRIEVMRVGYKQRPPKEKQDSKVGTDKASNDPVKQYGKDLLQAIAPEGTAPEDLAKTLDGKYKSSSAFENETVERAAKKVIAKRIEADGEGKKPPRDYLSMFVSQFDKSYYNVFDKNKFSDEQKEWLSGITGTDSLEKYLAAMPDDTLLVVQKLFHFLLLCIEVYEDALGLDDLKNAKDLNKNTFWEYAGMGVEEYKALYIEAAKEAAAEALKPKDKKGGKKKGAAADNADDPEKEAS